MGESHVDYSLLFQFPGIAGKPRLEVAGPCWWTGRQNVNGNAHATPPFSHFGEAVIQDGQLPALADGRCVDGEVSGWAWLKGGPRSISPAFAGKLSRVWIEVVDGRTVLRWIDGWTVKVLGVTDFPPAIPAPDIRPVRKQADKSKQVILKFPSR